MVRLDYLHEDRWGHAGDRAPDCGKLSSPLAVFGYVVLDFESGEVVFQMLGDGNTVQQELRQRY